MKIPVIKTYFRSLKKQKLMGFITIGGLSLSFAVLILMISYILQEYGYDKHYTHINSMYRIIQDNTEAAIPERAYNDVIQAAPEINHLGLFGANGVLCKYKDSGEYVRAVHANSDFLAIYDVQVIKGQSEDLLKSKDQVAVTESFANRCFPNENPLGQTLTFENKEEKIITAVINDPPVNSTVQYELVFNLNQNIFHYYRGYNNINYNMLNAVFTVKPGTDMLAFDAKIATVLQHYEGYEKTTLHTQPYKSVYFDTSSHDQLPHANVNMIKLLSIIALIILVLAIFNFININTATHSIRFKEVCVRKTSGAATHSVFIQFVKEAFIGCFIALAFSLLWAMLMSPIFTDLFGKKINVISALHQPIVLLSVLGVFIVVTSLTALFPSLIISRYNPIDLLHQKAKQKRKGTQGIFIVTQLTISIGLIIGLVAINKQIYFVKNKDLGFNKSLLLEINLNGNTQQHSKEIKEQLLSFPQITDISVTHGCPMNPYIEGSGSWKIDSTEYDIKGLTQINTDTSFLSTFQIKLLQGRNFRSTDKNVCFINEETYKHLGFENIENKTIWGSTIIGVVENFHFKELHNKLGFLQLQYNPDEISHLNIRITGTEVNQTLNQIRSVFREFEPSLSFEPVFYDDMINKMYQKEEKQAKVIKIYAVMALFLSCLGILGIIELSTKRRIKELGIRKVNGARVIEIITLLNKKIVLWVFLAFVIASPIAFWAMNKWLQSFAYKTTLSWWIFALAGFLALLIALLTVSWQSWKAATRNPVEALRYE